jgi:hypothetical protein
MCDRWRRNPFLRGGIWRHLASPGLAGARFCVAPNASGLAFAARRSQMFLFPNAKGGGPSTEIPPSVSYSSSLRLQLQRDFLEEKVDVYAMSLTSRCVDGDRDRDWG